MHDSKFKTAMQHAAIVDEFGEDTDTDLKWVLRELKALLQSARGDEDRMMQLGALKELRQPDARPIVQPESTLLALFLWHFRPLTPPDPFDPFVVHMPAAVVQHSGDHAVSISLQIVALLALAQLDPTCGITASMVFVMLVQGLSGVAKDLAKMGAKSAVKILAPTEAGGLFRWIAILSGSKNAVKGSGFLLGAALPAVFGFVPSVLTMAAILFIILVGVVIGMPSGLPVGRKDAKFSRCFPRTATSTG